MANLIRRAPLLACLLLSACGSRLPYELSAPQAHDAPAPAALTGTFSSTDLSTVDLSQRGDRPVVLIFSQDTCAACGTEADAIRAAMRHADMAPPRVNVYTILVGAILEDALDWKSAHGVPWTVGMDPQSTLFAQYCPSPRQVPCSVVYLPGRGIALQKNGGVSLPELEALTGDWEN